MAPQQRLIALRIGLSLAQELALHDPARCAARLDELGRDAEAALDELRSLAHGICPPLLADRGLADAVASAATLSPVPIDLHATGLARYPTEVETAVYSCILEALQNVAKHAGGIGSARVEIDGHEPGNLRFEVRDDGDGATDQAPEHGTGLTNMRDRIHAIGGELLVSSSPGLGTLIRGDVPLAGTRPR